MFKISIALILPLALIGCAHTSDGATVSVTPGNVTVTDKNGNTATVNSNSNETTIQSKDVTEHIGNNGISASDSKGNSFQAGSAVTEADLGVPFYPGSTDVPSGDMNSKSDKGTTVVSNRTTSDDGAKVIAFYTDKLGKPDTNMNSGDMSMGMWKKGKSVTTVMVSKGDTAGTNKISLTAATDK